jgi:hypothetical protein
VLLLASFLCYTGKALFRNSRVVSDNLIRAWVNRVHRGHNAIDAAVASVLTEEDDANVVLVSQSAGIRRNCRARDANLEGHSKPIAVAAQSAAPAAATSVVLAAPTVTPNPAATAAFSATLPDVTAFPGMWLQPAASAYNALSPSFTFPLPYPTAPTALPFLFNNSASMHTPMPMYAMQQHYLSQPVPPTPSAVSFHCPSRMPLQLLHHVQSLMHQFALQPGLLQGHRLHDVTASQLRQGLEKICLELQLPLSLLELKDTRFKEVIQETKLWERSKGGRKWRLIGIE